MMHLVRLWRFSTARPAVGLLLLGILVGAFAADTAAQAATEGLTISGPWIRMVLPSQPAAGYFTLSNATAEARTLVRASSPGCKTLMLHQTVNANGQEKMVMVMSIAVPANGKVEFAPGGYHLMCMSPTSAVTPGHAVRVTLHFKDGHTITAKFPVRDAKGMPAMPRMKGM